MTIKELHKELDDMYLNSNLDEKIIQTIKCDMKHLIDKAYKEGQYYILQKINNKLDYERNIIRTI